MPVMLCVWLVRPGPARASEVRGSDTEGGAMPYLECERETILGGEDVTEVSSMRLGRRVLVLSDNYFHLAWGLDPETHAVLWERRPYRPDEVGDHKLVVTPEPEMVRALYDDDVIVTGDEYIARLEGRTGRLKWHRELEDGFFSDEGWVELADDMACAVYLSSDQATGGLRGPNRNILFRLSSGEACDVTLSHVPLWLALDSPARFLYREPLFAPPDLYHGVRPEEVVKEYPFALGALAADTGRSLWCTDLGPISKRRIPAVGIVRQPLGVCRFKVWPHRGPFTEIAWLDLDSGEVLRTDKIAVNPHKAIALVASTSRQDDPSAADLLAQARVLAVDAQRLLLLYPDKPEQPMWITDLTDVLPPALRRETGVFWQFDVSSFPFGVVNADLGVWEESLLLVVDLRDGSLWRVPSAVHHTWALDGERGVIYVLSGQLLRRYRLPDGSRGKELEADRVSWEPVVREGEGEQEPP